MKRYNRLFALLGGIYIICGIFLVVCYYHVDKLRDNYYLVEVNRVLAQLQEEYRKNPELFAGEAIVSLSDNISLQKYETIMAVDFLSVNQKQESTLNSFYRKEKGEFVICPLYRQGVLLGYVRVVYREDGEKYLFVRMMAGVLLVIGGLLAYVFWHIRRNIVEPIMYADKFLAEMSKGNLNGEMKLEKNHYLSGFQNSVGRLRDELANVRHRELELLREKKLLILSLTHDVKTPLFTILLSARALQKQLYETEEQKSRAYQQIIEKGEEIQNYITEIAKGSTEELLEIPMEIEEFYLKDVVEHVNGDYREKCAIMQVEFVLGLYSNRIVKGDFHRTIEVIENLLENGLKYGDGIHLEIQFTEEEGCLLVHVINSGEPVEEKELPHLFESFYRGSNAKGRKGSGLGLYICKEVMQKMGGEIYAKRKEDGMEFVLVFER